MTSIHNRCVKTPFYALPLNSCSWLITRSSKKLVSNFRRQSENVFLEHQYVYRTWWENRHIIVGTYDPSLRRAWTHTPSILILSLKRYYHALLIQFCWWTVSIWGWCLQCFISWSIPILPRSDFSTRQQGHSIVPRNFISKINTLVDHKLYRQAEVILESSTFLGNWLNRRKNRSIPVE